MTAWLLPSVYGLSTLAFLWAMGGGDAFVFAKRQFVLAAVAFVGLALLSRTPLFRAARSEWWRPRGRREWILGAGFGIGLFAPTAAFALLLTSGALPFEFRPPAIPGGIAELSLMAIAGVVLAVSAEIFARGILSPQWGFGGVAFLDALVLGFGFQNGFVFISQWAVGLILARVATRASLGIAVVARAVWTLLTLGLLSAL